jgi:hypothetical protein
MNDVCTGSSYTIKLRGDDVHAAPTITNLATRHQHKKQREERRQKPGQQDGIVRSLPQQKKELPREGSNFQPLDNLP